MPPLWCRSRTPGIQADPVSRWKDATRSTSFYRSPLCRTHMAWGWGGIPLKPKPSGLGAVTLSMTANERVLRREIVTIGRLLYERGLIVAGDGNISARLGEGLVITTPA